jgi:hypothetical protein
METQPTKKRKLLIDHDLNELKSNDCPICLKKAVGLRPVIIIPCCGGIFHVSCFGKIKGNDCPLCRTETKARVRTRKGNEPPLKRMLFDSEEAHGYVQLTYDPMETDPEVLAILEEHIPHHRRFKNAESITQTVTVVNID